MIKELWSGEDIERTEIRSHVCREALPDDFENNNFASGS